MKLVPVGLVLDSSLCEKRAQMNPFNLLFVTVSNVSNQSSVLEKAGTSIG